MGSHGRAGRKASPLPRLRGGGAMLQEGINSFCTIEYAEEYFGGKVFAEEWDKATAETKEKALKEATRLINRLKFKGLKADSGQILEFPRQYPEVSNFSFGYVEQEDIPDEAKAATCEEALAILRYGKSARTKAQEQNVVSVKMGDASETYKAGSLGKLYSHEAYELLKPLVVGAVAIW